MNIQAKKGMLHIVPVDLARIDTKQKMIFFDVCINDAVIVRYHEFYIETVTPGMYCLKDDEVSWFIGSGYYKTKKRGETTFRERKFNELGLKAPAEKINQQIKEALVMVFHSHMLKRQQQETIKGEKR